MPPKKPVKRNNKKKKEKRDEVAATTGAASAKKGAAAPGLTLSDIQNKQNQLNMEELRDNIPNMFGDPTKSDEEQSRESSVGGVYGMYKRATQRFKEGLVALVPEHIFAMDRVQALMDAVDFLVEQQQTIEPALLDDCRTSLQFRKSYSKQFEGGGDQGHGYFILVLNYCYQCLKKLVPRTERDKVTAAKQEAKQFRFTDLELSDDSDDDDEDESGGDEKPAATRHPERPTGPEEEFTLDDLIEGTDRFKACIFLSDIECAMTVVANAYKTTKANMFTPEKEAMYFMSSLVATGAITNLALREVMLLEAELKVECPHLTTFYRVLACVFMDLPIDDLIYHLQESDVVVSKRELTAFMGDFVELVFRYPASMWDHIEPMIHDFCESVQLPRDDITEFMRMLMYHVRAQSLPTAFLKKDPEFIEQMKEKMGVEFHSWLDDRPYIGGGRSIINTQSLLESLKCNLTDSNMGKCSPKEGLFGDMWDEEERLAENIRGDMDQLLIEDIIPELLFSCQHGPLSLQVDAEFRELLPLFVLVKDYAVNPKKPVPVSLTFGIHAILTSIIELQGNKDLASIAKFCKDSQKTFFSQVEAQLKTKLSSSAIWKHLVDGIIWRKHLSTVFLTPVNDRVEDRAFWNPYCAGMFLGYLTYFINFVCGACLTDYFQQLRLVLHLHHALKLRNLVEDNVPLLIYLDRYFRYVPTIWQGEKPERDNIVKKFLIVNGRPLDVIRPLYEECRSFVLGQPIQPRKNFNLTRAGKVRRKGNRVRPESFLKTYRNIYEQEDKQNGRPEKTYDLDEIWNVDFARRVKDVVKKVTKEQPMYSLNMAAAAGCCDTFLRILVDRMKWRPLLNRVIANKPKCQRTACHLQKERIALCEVIEMFLLGPLEFIDDIENHQAVITARDCFDEYFDGLDRSEYEFLKIYADDDVEGIDGVAQEVMG